MEPLGSYQPHVSWAAGVALGAASAATAAGLFELSRSLADRYRGRWFAGNGRDVFHAAAVAALAAALFLCGLPPALACVAAATAAIVPLMVLDSIPRRRDRLLVLVLAVAVGVAVPVCAPRSVVHTGNHVARVLFGQQR